MFTSDLASELRSTCAPEKAGQSPKEMFGIHHESSEVVASTWRNRPDDGVNHALDQEALGLPNVPGFSCQSRARFSSAANRSWAASGASGLFTLTPLWDGSGAPARRT